MKRKLEGKELSAAMKGLEAKKQELDWLKYQIKYHELMLESGLEMNYKKNIRDFKQNKREHDDALKVVQEVINILQDQIRNGVEIKEDKKEDKE